METIGLWLSPVLLLPGTALLIISTSARYAQLHGELHHLIADRAHVGRGGKRHFLRRATLFRNALVALYGAVALFALSSLLGGLTSAWAALSIRIIVVLTCGGIALLLVAAGLLVRESLVSLAIIRDHVAQLDARAPS